MRRWGIGNFAYVAMAAGMLVAPTLATRSWSSGRSGDPSADAEPRASIDRVLEVDGWASEGGVGLAEEVASLPGPPSWDEVRRAMERRGCTALRYGLTIRCVLSDGTTNEWSLLRRPYLEPHHADEFLRFLRGGADAALWEGPGVPPWKTGPAGQTPNRDLLPNP